ncbi:MAG: EamA family transporter, partial [Erythrobacter sp.]|nr:EamA family transporter [Erythrobacter sp.]
LHFGNRRVESGKGFCLALEEPELHLPPTIQRRVLRRLKTLSSQIIGQGLLVYSLRNFPPLIIGMALLTQPALAATVGWLVFGEVLVPLDIVGMALVAAALMLAKSASPPRLASVRSG